MVDKSKNFKKYDKKKILSAMDDVKIALDKKNSTIKNSKQKNEDVIILDDLITDEVLVLKEVYFNEKKYKKISGQDLINLKYTISNLVKSDIDLWVKDNVNILLKKYIKQSLNLSSNNRR